MKLYLIKAPYMSKNNTRSYAKKMEIYCGTVEDVEEVIPLFVSNELREYKNGKWITKQSTERFTISKEQIHSNLSFGKHGILAFTSFELSHIAKIQLLDKMKTRFEADLITLREEFLRNYPNTDSQLQELKEEYPEMFI